MIVSPGKMVPIIHGSSGKGWHEVEAFFRCPKEYELNTWGVKPRFRQDTQNRFALGTMLHAARAQWLNDNYKGNLWVKALELAGKNYDAAFVKTANEAFTHYVKHWKLRPKPAPLAVEHHIKSSDWYHPYDLRYMRTARYDAIENYNLPGTKGVWIGEFKSGSAVTSQTDRYRLHGQTLLYMLLWKPSGMEKEFGPCAGVAIDTLQRGTKKNPWKCERVFVSIKSVSAALEAFRVSMQVACEVTADIRKGAVPGVRTWNCFPTYGACEFRELCARGKSAEKEFIFPENFSVQRATA